MPSVDHFGFVGGITVDKWSYLVSSCLLAFFILVKIQRRTFYRPMERGKEPDN